MKYITQGVTKCNVGGPTQQKANMAQQQQQHSTRKVTGGRVAIETKPTRMNKDVGWLGVGIGAEETLTFPTLTTRGGFQKTGKDT